MKCPEDITIGNVSYRIAYSSMHDDFVVRVISIGDDGQEAELPCSRYCENLGYAIATRSMLYAQGINKGE